MKKNLLVVFAIGLSGLSYAQCEILGTPASMCVSDAPVALSLTDHPDIDEAAAVYSGPGVSGATFSPTAAGLGVHTIEVEAPGDGYNVDETIPFAPIDISGGGATDASGLMGDDNTSGFLPIGFNFTFFGNEYDEFQIGSNGFLTFNASTAAGCCSGQFLPNGSEPNNLVAFAWEDLDPGNGGAPAINLVRYEVVGAAPNRILVVEFFNVDHWSAGLNVFCHTQLYESTNCIEVHIASQPDAGTHTLGIENIDGSEAYAAAGKNGSVWTATDFAVQFCPKPPCTGTVDVEVVSAPNVDATIDVEEICFGETVTIDVTGTADEYSFGAGIEAGVPFVPTTEGENVYIVAGTDTDAGCIANDMVSVFVHPIPYVYAGDDMNVCEDNEFVLAAVGDEADYTWDMGVTDGEEMTQAVGTVTYTVTASNAGDCEASSSTTVTSLEAPSGTGVVTMMTGLGFDGEIDFTPSGGTGGPYTFLWSNGETTEDINSLIVGSYTVTVSDGECDSDVTFIVDSQAGIELEELNNLKVYPNPVVDFVTIEFDGTYNWILYDNTGKIVSNGQGNGIEKISMENLADGNYLVKVSVDGKESTVSIVKE